MNSPNISGFSGSVNLYNNIQNLVEKYSIRTVIETGTYKGHTSSSLSDMVSYVVTIEKNKDQADEALSNGLNGLDNVDLLVGDSAERLPDALEGANSSILFYLDAHSPSENPIRDELETIANYCVDKPIIVVHDIKNPYRGDLGYNQYNDGTELTWSYICDLISEIYEGQYNVSFNKDAPSDERGVAFVEPE